MLQIHLKKRNYTEQRSPTLNTVLMVEETLMNICELLTVAELKRKLPKQIMHQTLIKILDYLSYSGKIVFHEDKILWTFNPKSKLKKKITLKVK